MGGVEENGVEAGLEGTPGSLAKSLD